MNGEQIHKDLKQVRRFEMGRWCGFEILDETCTTTFDKSTTPQITVPRKKNELLK